MPCVSANEINISQYFLLQQVLHKVESSSTFPNDYRNENIVDLFTLGGVHYTVGGTVASWLVRFAVSSSAGLSPGRDTVLCSWARHFTLTVPLPTQVYKWVPLNCEVNVSIETFSRFMKSRSTLKIVFRRGLRKCQVMQGLELVELCPENGSGKMSRINNPLGV